MYVIICSMKGWLKVLVLLIGVVFWVFSAKDVFASVNDFYFEDFRGDYYLSKVEDGTSRLKVVENVTAVFPEYKQNKGICRMIPFTNQDGMNVTLPNLTRSNIKVTRNGVSEPIYSIEKKGDYFEVCTGTEEYVLGKQVYGFEYEYERVVTEFDAEGNNVSGQNVEVAYQELYWDTNGTGSSQRFDKVTARVHFVGDALDGFTGESWCYVGRYGLSDQDRCTTTKTSDGVEFVASGLKAYENLTFDVEIRAGSFVVPEPNRNYTLVWILIAVGGLLGVITILPVKNYLKAGPKRKFYKGFFVKPEYQPNAEYTVAEMAEVYIGKTENEKVAVLLNLIVKKKISLLKTGEKKKKGWKVKILSLDGVEDEAKTMLAILNGGSVVEVGDEIEIKAQVATSKLVALGKKYNDQVVSELKKDGLVEEKYSTGAGKITFGGLLTTLVVVVSIVIGIVSVIYDENVNGGVLHGYIVGKDFFLPALIVMLVVAIILWSLLYSMSEKYALRTKKGLTASRYMDGAKLYIGMAEAERLKMLQSVKGADTTNEGIVRLYERMLPYAAVLGLEDSWMKELEKYYKLDEVTEPEWHRNGFTVRDMYYASMLASSYSRSATTMSTGSGGSSSGFSGGGGGGFSGGGGGEGDLEVDNGDRVVSGADDGFR